MDAANEKNKINKRKKNEYYERWLTEKTQQERAGSESNLDTFTP